MTKRDSFRDTFNAYDPEQDPNGSIGIALADEALRIFNYDLDSVQEWANSNKKYNLEEVSEYALIYSEREKVSNRNGNMIRERLRKLKELG